MGIAIVTKLTGGLTDEANARFIVQACNSHADLLEALKIALSAVEWMAEATDADPEDHERLVLVTEAIRKAEEQS